MSLWHCLVNESRDRDDEAVFSFALWVSGSRGYHIFSAFFLCCCEYHGRYDEGGVGFWFRETFDCSVLDLADTACVEFGIGICYSCISFRREACAIIQGDGVGC